MSTNSETLRLLDAASAAHGGCSDYRIARLLNVTTSSTTGWRKGRHLSDEYAVKLSELAGLDPVESVLRVTAERESGITARVMKLALERLHHAASILLALLLGVVLTGIPARSAFAAGSSTVRCQNVTPARGPLYIFCKIACGWLRAGLRRLAAPLARLLPAPAPLKLA